MKKRIGILITSVILFACTGLSLWTSAYSLSSLLPGFSTEEYIYIADNLPYSLLDESLAIEFGDLYISNEEGSELQPDETIATGCKLMKKQESGDTLLFTYIVLGDIDRDGKVTPADARTALRMSAKLDASPSDFIGYASADVDGSYTINSADARLILRYAAQIETYETLSAKKLQNLNSADLSYILVDIREMPLDCITEAIDSELLSGIIPIPDEQSSSLFLKVKEPSRDHVDELLYALNQIDGIYVNNPLGFDDDLVIF